MDSLGGKVLQSVIILPLMAGNYRRRRSGSWYNDCTISSRVLFLIVLSIVIVFTASNRILKHAQIRLAIVVILLSILMVSALIGFAIIGCLVNKNGIRSIVAARRDTSTPKLQVVFIWIFGLASVSYCTFVLCKQIECSINLSGGLFWNTLLAFNIILVVCVFSQMIVITYFSPYELKPTKVVNFAMFMLLITNVSMLLYVFLINNTFGYIWHRVQNKSTNSCLVNNSTISILIQKSKPILRPTFTEFCLLSCTILLEIWSPTKVHFPDEEPTDIDISDMHDYERLPLLTSVRGIERHIRNEGRRTVCQLVTKILSIILGLGLTVFYVAMAMGIGNIDSIHNVVQIYELTLKILMILSIFVGFFCLVNYCTPDHAPQALRSREYVYLLSAFGIFMMHIGKGIGGDVSPDETSYILLYTSIISLFQDYLQVVFLLHANRYKKSDPRSNIHLLESVLIFTMITNSILWFNDSFLISEFGQTRLLQNYPWNLMYEYLLPIVVFYRYTSFLEYYALFSRYNT